MEDDKKCEVGQCLKNSISNLVWLINSNQNLMEYKTWIKFYYTPYTVNIPIIPWIYFFKFWFHKPKSKAKLGLKLNATHFGGVQYLTHMLWKYPF
jgi:hypothetical protein